MNLEQLTVNIRARFDDIYKSINHAQDEFETLVEFIEEEIIINVDPQKRDIFEHLKVNVRVRSGDLYNTIDRAQDEFETLIKFIGKELQ